MHELEHIKQFVSFAAKELKLASVPHINFVGNEENKKQTFGHTKDNVITVRVTGRHPVDVMRTVAHELIHFKQGNKRSSEQAREDEANAIAGRVMRAYATKYPNAFKHRSIREDTVSATPVNAMGASAADPTTGNIQGYSPIMMQKNMLKRPKPLSDIIGKRAMLKDLKKDKKNGV